MSENGLAPDRVDFSKIKTSIPIPNLIEVQKNSYEKFLQMDLLPNERDDIGLQTVFTSVFPISDFRGVSQLEFVDYSIGNWECKCGNLKGLHHLRSTCRNPSCGATINTDPFHAGDILCHHCGTFNRNIVTFCNKCGDPVGLQLKYDQAECEERGMTYAAPLKVTIRLTVYAKDRGNRPEERARHQRAGSLLRRNPADDEQWHVHHQWHRARDCQPVASFAGRVLREASRRRATILGKIIPYRGSWVEFEYDNKNLLYVRIDRKRKFYGSVFLRALGLETDEQILKTFYRITTVRIKDTKLLWNVDDEPGRPEAVARHQQQSGRSGGAAGPQDHRGPDAGNRQEQDREVEVASNDLEGAFIAADVVDMSTGEVMIDANQELTPTVIGKLIEAGID